MGSRADSRRHGWGSLVLFLVVAVSAMLTIAGGAAASPPANTISEDDLQALLSTGPVSGYFETVIGGQTLASQLPVHIPVTVQSIVPDGGMLGDLYLFEASGPVIDTIGGIAAGMSGSPLYVDDGSGTPKLAGAVSYLNFFTTHNLGLATPIDDMTAIESAYFAPSGAARSSSVPVHVATPAGMITRVVVARSRAAAATMRPAAGTVVMVPLTTLQINGLIPSSVVYKKLAAKLTAMGFDLSSLTAGRYEGAVAPPTLAEGGSLGVMYADGDFALGGLGTVTYVDPDNHVVVAFGHPFDYTGPSMLDLTSAWVQGTWSSGYEPMKVMSPVAVIGSITQDRGAGVAGVLGPTPVEVPVTSSATLNGVTKTSAGTVTQWIADNADFSDLPSAAAAVAMERVTDVGAFPGSATSTVKIKVTDGVHEYDVQRSDLWSDTGDVMSDATDDIDFALGAFTSGLPGMTAKVETIDFATTLSSADRSAAITDVTVPGGLRTGANHLTVSLLTANGDTVHVPVTLTIPRGTATSGEIEVFSGASSPTGGMSARAGGGAASRARLTAGRRDAGVYTLADLVAAINETPKNTDLDIVYSPDNEGAVIQPVEVLAHTGAYVIEGDLKKVTATLLASAPRFVSYREPVFLRGMIAEADASTTVHVYERPAGQSTDKLVASLPARLANDSSASFGALLRGLQRNTRLRVTWNGDADHLAQSVTMPIAVQAWVGLSASAGRLKGRPAVRFAVHIAPAQTDGVVVVVMEQLSGAHWVRKAVQPARGTVAGIFSAAPGRYRLRAYLENSTSNAAAASGSARVTVR